MSKHELHESIPLCTQRLNYGVSIYELEDQVGGKKLSLN